MKDSASERNVLRIVIPFTGVGVGGAQVSSTLLASALRSELGWDVRIAIPQDGPHARLAAKHDVPADIYASRLNVTPPGSRANAALRHFMMFWWVLRYLWKIRPDIVNIHVDAGFFIWASAARLLGMPVVWYVRASQRRGWRDRMRLRLSSRLIFVADAVVGRFKGCRLPPHCTIRNGVSPEYFDHFPYAKRIRAEFSLKEGDLLVLFVGNLVPRKRPEWAARSVSDAISGKAPLHLVIVGDHRDDSAVADRISAIFRQRSQTAHVHFAGYREDVMDLMRASDILVLSSEQHGEAFPRVVIEAMAAGICVVATNVAGVAEAVTNGVDGLLVPHNDRLALVNALVQVSSDDRLRERLAAAAQATAMRRFRQQIVAREFSSFVMQGLRCEPLCREKLRRDDSH